MKASSASPTTPKNTKRCSFVHMGAESGLTVHFARVLTPVSAATVLRWSRLAALRRRPASGAVAGVAVAVLAGVGVPRWALAPADGADALGSQCFLLPAAPAPPDAETAYRGDNERPEIDHTKPMSAMTPLPVRLASQPPKVPMRKAAMAKRQPMCRQSSEAREALQSVLRWPRSLRG